MTSDSEAMPAIEIWKNPGFTGFAISDALAANESVHVLGWAVLGPESASTVAELCEQFFDESVRSNAEKSGTSIDCAPIVVALLGKTGRVRIWVVDKVESRVKARRRVQAGETLYEGDIGDIVSIKMPALPEDVDAAGFFMTVRWRFMRAIAFLAPCIPDGVVSPGMPDLSVLAGSLLNMIVFRARWSVAEGHLKTMREAGWFPFAAFRPDTIELLKAHAVRNEKWDEFESAILEEFGHKYWDRRLESWQENPVLKPRIQFIKVAVNNIERGDAISAVSVITPVVEGVCGSAFGSKYKWPKVRHLLDDVNVAGTMSMSEIWHPHIKAFVDYLKYVHFAQFEIASGDVEVGRNSVAHGAVDPSSIKMVHAVKSLLILDQIALYAV